MNFEGLPNWMFDKLKDQNILPEFCALDDIQENAWQIEELALRTLVGVSNHLAGAPPPRTNSARSPNTMGVRPSRTAQGRFANKDAGVTNPMSAPARPTANINRVPTGGPRLYPPPWGDIECYSCGAKGHISTDPTCPKFKERHDNPQFHAGRISDGVDEEDPKNAVGGEESTPVDENDEISSNTWGGSQYEPDDSGFDVVDDTSDQGEDEEVRVASMHTIHMAAICVIDESDEMPDLLPQPNQVGIINRDSTVFWTSTIVYPDNTIRVIEIDGGVLESDIPLRQRLSIITRQGDLDIASL